MKTRIVASSVRVIGAAASEVVRLSGLAFGLAVLGLLLASVPVWGQALQTQTNHLAPGWNLVAPQVVPPDPSPGAVFGPLGNDFVAAWTYDNLTRRWTRYARPGTPDATNNAIAPMGPVEVGKAYWVYMNAARTWLLQGSPPAQTPALNFQRGWNLAGVPVGAAQLPEPVSMASVLAASGLDYDVILKWETGLYKAFTPSDDDLDAFTMFDPNKGYWVHVNTTNYSLQPKLVSSVRADVDVEPQGNFPSFEDLELSESVPPHQPRAPLGPHEQTHIVFLPGEDVQQLAVANTGGGILLWELQWAPRDATNVAWLLASANQGVTTIENDVINLYLDRTSLVQGTYRGTLILRTTAGNRTFQVVAHVPGLGGEWRGSAQVSSVNGRANPVPEIDLHLDFYEDPTVPGLLRGLIDSRNALLWPVDVPLIGHILTSHANTFTLSGGYVLPPGDQNNPPYDKFAALDPGDVDLNDVDWDCNRQFDAVNPYPFPIYRSVTLAGSLVEANPAGSYRLEGHYVEMVYGLLRQPIRLEGTFSLRRESPKPFTNRRPVPNVELANGTQPVVLRTFQPPWPREVPPGLSSNTLTFVTDMVLESVAVEVDLADAPANAIKLSVVAPSGQGVVLHDRANLVSLRNLSFPSGRTPKEPLDNLAKAGVPTKGPWRLVIQNFGATTGKLYSWSLRLQGQPVFDVAGRVVASGSGTPLPAQVFLDGVPISEIAVANPADGSFLFSRLPGLPLNFTANLAGYEPVDPARPGLAALYTTPHFATNCGSGLRDVLAAKFRPLPVLPIPASATPGFGTYGTPANPVILQLQPRADLGGTVQLLAAPTVGPCPLTVEFNLVGPPAALPPGTVVNWTFGDGASASGAGLFAVSHTYTNVATNGYTATASVSGQPTLTQRILVMPSPGRSPYVVNIFQPFFTAGGALPADFASRPPGPANPTQPPQPCDLILVQHAYAASCDLDLAPRTTPGGSFFADNFDPSGVFTGDPANRGSGFGIGFKEEDFNYQVQQGTGPGQWEYSAACGYAVDDNRYDRHPKPGASGPCASERLRLLCNIGPPLVPPPNAEVYAPGQEILPPVGLDPLLDPNREGVARTRDVQMITGPLASFWTKRGAP